MFWKTNKIEFKVGDTVKFKTGTKHGRIRTLVVDNWYGEVIEVDAKGAVLAFDSITIAEFSAELIEIYNEDDMYPHIGYFPNKYLELAQRRDTQEDVIRAQDDLIERIDISNGISKHEIEYDRWIRRFMESNRYKALTEADKSHAGFILENFYNYMENYEEKKPSRWNISSVRNVLTKWVPRKVTAEQETFECYGVVILEFFKFLDENGYRKMTSLIPVAIKARDKIVEESQKREYWGHAKAFLMEAIEEGVDPEDPKAINRFMRKKQFQALKQLRNTKDESAPKSRTVSRTVDTKQFKNIWQNQKITVQYPDGTIKEDIKFKDVKNDLYEGLCELIKK